MPIEGKCVAIQVIEGKFARSPRCILDFVGSAPDTTLPIFIEERVWILNQKPQANAAHFVLELKLHVELDRVAAKSDIIRCIGVVLKGQPEAKLLGVEPDRPMDVPRAENRMGFFEHCWLRYHHPWQSSLVDP